MFLCTIYWLCTNKKEKTNFLVQSTIFSAIPLIGIVLNAYVIPVYDLSPIQPYCLVPGTVLAYLFIVDKRRNEEAQKQIEKSRGCGDGQKCGCEDPCIGGYPDEDYQ